MKAKRWQQVEQLYQAALDIEAGRRGVFLNQACAGDQSLRREVESLLERKAEMETFLETPALELAAEALAEDQAGAPLINLAGSTIAHYRIVEKIGAGGMGEVYRGRDTKLGRDVAIKVLPPYLAHDPDRLRRFEREAHLLAALNHPHIAGIHSLEEVGNTCALVLELVEGPTLADRLAAGPLPVNETLVIAGQIADALEAAHGYANVLFPDLLGVPT